MAISRSIHVTTNSIISLLSMAEYYSTVYMYHIFFLHSSVNGHLGCFHILTIVNSATIIFEIALNYCISDSFVDHGGYSISSKGFLPAVVAIMVIRIKFTHSHPFLSTDS